MRKTIARQLLQHALRRGHQPSAAYATHHYLANGRIGEALVALDVAKSLSSESTEPDLRTINAWTRAIRKNKARLRPIVSEILQNQWVDILLQKAKENQEWKTRQANEGVEVSK